MKLANPDDRAEYDTIIRDACERADGTGWRVNLVAAGVADALQAHRPWATEIQEQAQLEGYSRDIKRWLKRARVLVVLDGRRVSKPLVIGTRRSDDSGKEYDAQLPIVTLSFEEIRQQAKEAAQMAITYSDTRRFLDAVVALADRVPDAVTPADALLRLGISLDEWLAA